MILAVGWLGGIVLSIVPMLIDTRAPMRWWQRVYRQTREGSAAIITAIWADQVLHILVIAIWVGVMPFLNFR